MSHIWDNEKICIESKLFNILAQYLFCKQTWSISLYINVGQGDILIWSKVIVRQIHWLFVPYLGQWKSLVIFVIFGTMKSFIYNFRSKHCIIVTVTYKYSQMSYLLWKKYQCHKITHKGILTDFSGWILTILKSDEDSKKKKKKPTVSILENVGT